VGAAFPEAFAFLGGQLAGFVIAALQVNGCCIKNARRDVLTEEGRLVRLRTASLGGYVRLEFVRV
jgi:hypothetical protein